MTGGPGLGTPLGPDGDRDLESEIRFHLERKVEALVAHGWSRSEAEEEARRKFGNVEDVRMGMKREARLRVRDDRVREWFDARRQDARYAWRQWARNPGFAAIIVGTLALGIGANTAIFSVVDHVLLRPLPYPAPQQLAVVWSDVTRRGGPADEWLSYSNFMDVRDLTPGIEHGALWSGFQPTLTGRGEPTAIPGAVVTQGMLGSVLGVEPVIGRGFAAEEDVPGGPNVVIVSDRFWRDVMGGQPSAVGETLLLNDVAYETIGVLPAGVRHPFLPDAELWTLAQLDPVAQAQRRGAFNWRSVVRMEAGAELDDVRAQVEQVAGRLEAEHPEANTGMGFALNGLQDDLVGPASAGLWVVMGSVVLLLLVACVNVANLLLARATARLGELSVRSALGAGRRRIVSQLVVESVGLGLIGGVLGAMLGVVGTRALVALAPEGTPRIEAVSVDLRVLGVTLVVSALAGLFFGLVPALQVSGRDLQARLREEGREGRGGRAGLRLRNALVAAQVALALVVLVTAGLLTRSFANLRAVDMGFEPAGALTFFVNLPQSRYPDSDAVRPAVAEIESRLAALPGVVAVGTTNSLPLAGFDSDVSFNVAGRAPAPPGREPATWLRRVTPGFAEALGLRTVSGRWIEERDAADGATVLLINETFAERHFASENPIGRQVDFGEPGGTLWEIVGVVADTRHFSLRDDRREAVYLPFVQAPVGSTFMVVRGPADRDPTVLAPEIRRVMADFDPALALQTVTPMSAAVAGALGPDRFLTTLLSLFGGVTLLLAVVGLYGVISVSVSARRRELGVRMALGAPAGRIGGLVVTRALVLTFAGIGAGLGLALTGVPLLRSLLYGIGTTDPLTFALVGGLLLLVAVGAAAVPAWRASRVDPVRALRAE